MLLTLLLAGCAAPTPPPAPITLQIIAAPSANQLAAQAGRAYAAQHSYVIPQQSEDAARGALAALATGGADLALIERPLQPAEMLNPVTGRRGLYSWPMGRAGVAIIVHPDNPVATLSLKQLQRTFTGEEADWQALGGAAGPVQTLIREPGAASQIAFEEGVLQGRRGATTAIVMPSDHAIADYVSRNAGAIGYVSMGTLPSGVKVIGINGILPLPAEVAQGRYPLSHPLVLVARSPLTTRAWGMVSFLLGPEGQSLIAGSAAPAR